MARDDDDDDLDEPVTKRRKVRNDDEDEERPRKKNARVDDEEDEDRPRKKKGGEDSKDERDARPSTPLPGALLGVILACAVWGGMILHSSCSGTAMSLLIVIQQQNMRGIGFNQPFPIEGGGLRYTMLGAQLMLLVFAAVLVAGAGTLVARKKYGKFMAMGAPIGMVLVEVAAFVICLILTSGVFMTGHNVGFGINIFFSLVVGGLSAYLLMDKNVNKVLK